MKRFLSEKNLVVVLFVLVFVTFVLAHEDTKQMERAYTNVSSPASASLTALQKQVKELPVTSVKD